MARAYYNRGILLVKQRISYLDAAIKDFEEASKLQPETPVLIFAWACYRQKGRRDLGKRSTSGKRTTPGRAQENQLRSHRCGFPRQACKAVPDLQPDADLDPLEKAKQDLEKQARCDRRKIG